MRGHDKTQACFRFRLQDRVAVVLARGSTLRATNGTRTLCRSDVWKLVERLQQADPRKDILELLYCWLKVCPEGMITRDVQKYLEMEMVCETYKTPPVAGGVEDWPAMVYDAFVVIRQTHQAIKIEKNRELRSRTGKQ